MQLGKGRLGFYFLSKGIIVTFFFSILPISCLILWARLPHEYYLILNKLTKHGSYSTFIDGQTTKQEFFRFGMLLLTVKRHYYNSGNVRLEEQYVGDKLNGTVTHWQSAGGKILVESFVNNRRHGRSLWFDKNGKQERSINYYNGISQDQIDAAKSVGVEPIIAVDLGDDVKMRMVFIPPGEFLMGSPYDDKDRDSNETPQRKISIKQGFYICETEITQLHWNAIMKIVGNDYFIKDVDELSINNANFPQGNVSWSKAKDFIYKLNQKKIGTFRLPTEAEWEYACRAGTTTTFNFSGERDLVEEYAWTNINSDHKKHLVAKKQPNNWGLYDMIGNASEWVEDNWHTNYENAPNSAIAWIDIQSNKYRVLRGGSWVFNSWSCRSASRTFSLENDDANDCGFRCVMEIR